MLTIMYNSIKTWQTSSKKQLSQTVAAFITENQFETFIVAGLKFVKRTSIEHFPQSNIIQTQTERFKQ